MCKKKNLKQQIKKKEKTTIKNKKEKTNRKKKKEMPTQTSKYTIVGPTYKNDELRQESVKTRTFIADIHGPTVTTCKLNLPSCLLHTYWKRHNLSMNDVQQCLEYNDALRIWLLALLFGIDSSSSSLKPSFATSTGVLVSSKAISVRKLLRKLNITLRPNDCIGKFVASLVHVPGLPSHCVSPSLFNRMSRALTPNLNIFETICVSDIVPFKDILWLPRAFEGTAIYVTRVVKLSVFEESRKYIGTGLATQGYKISYEGDVFVCVEESFLALSQ